MGQCGSPTAARRRRIDMERLTEYQETEGGIPFVVLKNNNGDPVQEAFQRLAAYEDTGYCPNCGAKMDGGGGDA